MDAAIESRPSAVLAKGFGREVRERVHKFRSRPKSRRVSRRWPWLAAAILSYGALAAFSPRTSLDSDKRIIEEPLEIRLNRTSPAFAALEDSMSDFEEVPILLQGQVFALSAGVLDGTQIANAIASSNERFARERELSIQRTLQAAESERRRLAAAASLTKANRQQPPEKPMAVPPTNEPSTLSGNRVLVTVHRSETAPDSAREEGASPVDEPIVAEPGSMIVSGGKIMPLEPIAVEKVQIASAGAQASGHSAGQHAADAAVTTYSHPTRKIDLAELKLNRADLIKGLFLPMVNAAAQTQTAPKVIVSARASRTQPPQLGGLGSRRPSPEDSEAAKTGVSTRSALTSGQSEPASFKAERNLDPNSSVQPLTQLVVSGHVEFAGGLAITSPQDQILVYREYDDEVTESGQVWFREARYEIFVTKAIGHLVAELRTPHGDVIGRGSLDLEKASAQTAKNQHRVDGINLVLKPSNRGLRGLVRSAYSHGSKIQPVAGAQLEIGDLARTHTVKENGRFLDRKLAPGSSVVVRATHAGYWHTLGFAAVGIDNDVTLYPDKMMNAFTELVTRGGDLDRLRESAAVVWGRALHEGKPVGGARVELLTGEKEVRPVYFNSLMIPDPSLTETSSNGMYAFFPVEPGVHAIQVEYRGSLGDPVLFPAEERHVSSVDLETVPSRDVILRVYDALNPSHPLAAKVTPVGAEGGFDVGAAGETKYVSAQSSGLLTLDADAGAGYVRTRVSAIPGRKTVAVPMVSSEWLADVRSRIRLNREPSTGIIVGFVRSRTDWLIKPAPSEKRAVRVVYFDQTGRLLATDHGVPGGGYAIFNVEEGFSTVTLTDMNASTLHAVTVLTDKDVVNVIRHSLN